MEGKQIKDALVAEDQYFRKSESYGALSNRCGVPFLCRTLNEIIVKHIKKCLPIIRLKITSMLYQKEK